MHTAQYSTGPGAARRHGEAGKFGDGIYVPHGSGECDEGRQVDRNLYDGEETNQSEGDHDGGGCMPRGRRVHATRAEGADATHTTRAKE